MVEFRWHEPRDLLSEGLTDLIHSDVTIHMKGFTSGIQFDHPHNLHQKSLLIAAIASTCAHASTCALIFDGDSYYADSFTYLITQLAEELPHISFQYWATLRCKQESERFKASWRSTPLLVIDVVPASHLSPDCAYEILGHHTLLASKAETVLCIGGGGCIIKEETSAKDMGIWFTVFDFIRLLPDKGLQRHTKFDGQPIHQGDQVAVPL